MSWVFASQTRYKCTHYHHWKNLGGFKHDLCRVIKKSQRPFGESMGTHENCRELDISLPWIHHLLGSKALEINQQNIHKALNKCKVPAIAELKPVVHIFLTYAVNKIAKEKPRRANEELFPSWSISQRNSKQRPFLLFILHCRLSLCYFSLVLNSRKAITKLSKGLKMESVHQFDRTNICMSPYQNYKEM